MPESYDSNETTHQIEIIVIMEVLGARLLVKSSMSHEAVMETRQCKFENFDEESTTGDLEPWRDLFNIIYNAVRRQQLNDHSTESTAGR